MADFVPHTDAEVATMLAFIGLSSVDELFSAVPVALRLAAGLDIAPGLSESDVLSRFGELAAANRPAGPDLVCFAGAGAYDHDVPAVVRRLAFRSEFVTAYTPYQPEVAQGVLQALFEYQTLVCRLSGMDVANASLYDGASACVEAVNLAVAASGRPEVWVSRGVHPHWREVIRTFAAGTRHDIREIPLGSDGTTAWPIDGNAGAVLVQHPNYLGCIEDLSAASETARRAGALLTVATDPVAAGILRPPAYYGADVVVGEGQPFGTPLSFGGPFLGTFACRLEHVRRLPGRLVGETVDVDGRRAYVTTLRTREQDIRREKASSNVCTNQTLIAVAYAVHLAWVGTAGLRELALRCARGTRYAREGMLAIEGVEPATAAPVLREFAVRLPLPAAEVVDRMAEEGFLAGVALGEEYDTGLSGREREAGHTLLVAVTEKRTRAEVDRYIGALEKIVR